MFSLWDSVLAAERQGWWVRPVGAPRPSAPVTIHWKYLVGAKFFAGRAARLHSYNFQRRMPRFEQR